MELIKKCSTGKYKTLIILSHECFYHRRPKYSKFSKSGNFGDRSPRNIMTLRIRNGEILTRSVVCRCSCKITVETNAICNSQRNYSMMLLYSGENDILMDATLSINHTGQAEKYACPVWLILRVASIKISQRNCYFHAYNNHWLSILRVASIKISQRNCYFHAYNNHWLSIRTR